MLVVVYSRKDLLDDIKSKKLKTGDKYIISLSTPDLDYTEQVDCSQFKSSLEMSFHDILDDNGMNGIPITSKNSEVYTQFTERDAIFVIHFIKNIPSDGVLVVHCDAGLSRSVAVGRFVVENIEDSVVSYITARDDRYANISILNKLRNVLRADYD